MEEKEQRIEELISAMSLDEKFDFLSGKTNFTMKPIPRLGIPEFGMTDGPHGCGKHSANGTKNTYFPAAIGIAAAWNTEMAETYGKALAQETKAVGRHVILAPGMNICRTPINGRTFEYLSEDPLLNAELSIRLVRGIQSQKISACIKHFCCNNYENARRFGSSNVSERALEEIYWPSFKRAIQEGGAWMMMGSYNRVNGKWVYENPELLSGKVCDEWGYKYAIVTDWFASHALRNPAIAIKSKLSIEMPQAIVYKKSRLQKAFKNGEFTEEELNECIRRSLRVMLNTWAFETDPNADKGSRNTPEHQQIAQKMAEESFVLLKNNNKILPLQKGKKVYLGGKFADYNFAPSLYGGSSAVSPPEFKTLRHCISEIMGSSIQFVKKAKDADYAIIATGFSHAFFEDAEGSDRRSIKLKPKYISEIENTAKENPNTIVVLFGGSACEMDPWLDKIAGLLVVWQPHQMGGNAITNILFGMVTPSGKLPITFPKKLEDIPAHSPKYEKGRTYPAFKYGMISMALHEQIFIRKFARFAKRPDVYYEEGIYVGYRHFDTNKVEPLFPFGFGLSYTEFEYSNLAIDKKKVSLNDSITVSVDITNKGKYDGAEIIQVYFHDQQCELDRPEKELCGFSKITLKSGEKKTAKITIPIKHLRYYNSNKKSWTLEPGKIDILVGSSSRDIKLKDTIEIQ